MVQYPAVERGTTDRHRHGGRGHDRPFPTGVGWSGRTAIVVVVATAGEDVADQSVVEVLDALDFSSRSRRGRPRRWPRRGRRREVVVRAGRAGRLRPCPRSWCRAGRWRLDADHVQAGVDARPMMRSTAENHGARDAKALLQVSMVGRRPGDQNHRPVGGVLAGRRGARRSRDGGQQRLRGRNQLAQPGRSGGAAGAAPARAAGSRSATKPPTLSCGGAPFGLPGPAQPPGSTVRWR